jgi:hypothetical protein
MRDGYVNRMEAMDLMSVWHKHTQSMNLSWKTFLKVRVEERHRDGESGEKKHPLLVVYGQCISYIW